MGKPESIKLASYWLALCLVTTVVPSWTEAAFAKHSKSNASSVTSQSSMCILPIIKGADGQQYIVTRAGYQVNIPGLGVAKDAKEIEVYADGKKHFWYVDRNGRSVKMSDQQVEWGLSQVNVQAQAAQRQAMQAPLAGQASMEQPGTMLQPNSMAMPYAVPNQPTTVVVQPTTVIQSEPQGHVSASGNSALVNGLVTAGSAAAGAAAGAALTNSIYKNNYYGVPYGTPIYHGGNKYYYNGSNGHRVYVAPNAHYTNQWQHEQEYREDRRDYHKDKYNNLNKNQQQMIKNQAVLKRNERVAGGHSAHFSSAARTSGRSVSRSRRR
jgi:hypothetical protein